MSAVMLLLINLPVHLHDMYALNDLPCSHKSSHVIPQFTKHSLCLHRVRLINSQCLLCFAVKEASIDPMGANGLYAAPEVLDSMLSRFDPSSTGSMLVNGAAADVWSAGIVLFQALTSDVPFKARPYRLPPPPDHVTQEEMQAWEQHAGIRLSQQLWVSSSQINPSTQ